MNAILCETGLSFSIDEYNRLYGNSNLLKLQKRFTIRTVDRVTKIPKVTKMFNIIKGDNKRIELPRFACNVLCTDKQTAKTPIVSVEYQLPIHTPIATIKYTGHSNPNQKIVVDYIVNMFKSSNTISGVTIKVAPGLGKSFIAKDIIDKLKLKTLIVVPNTYLLEQWVSLLKQYFPGVNIGLLYGKHKIDGDIIVGIINTVSELKSYVSTQKRPTPNIGKRVKYVRTKRTVSVDEILQKVGLTIFDESHLYVSKEFRKVFKRIWSRYTIGLSATPDIREDKLDVIHRAWLGPILDAETLDGFDAVQDVFESEVRMINYHALDKDCTYEIREDGMINYASIIESITNDPNRNALIVDQVMDLMGIGLFTFVFSDRRAHLEHLYDLIHTRIIERAQNDSNKTPTVLELPDSDKKVILYGGSDEDTINKAKEVSTIVLTTYSYSSTGVSITKMNGLIMATPRRSNMMQITGRVFRLGSDQSIKRVIVDIADAKLPLKSQIYKRMATYRERNCVIKKTTVIVDDQK